MLEYFQDLKRYYDDKKWGKFYDNYRNDPEEYEGYSNYFHNSYDDYEEAARDLCSEIREYMDLVWNEIPEDQVKLFDDGEKHNVREWLDETSRMFWNKLDNLTERETYGFLLQGYKMLKWIENAGRKTPDEFYGKYTGGQMPYYLGESKLKETSTILLTSHHHTDLPNNTPVRDGCSKCGDRSPDKVLQALKYWCDDFNIEDISGPEDNERICVDCFKKICKDRGVRLGKKHWWMKEALGRGFGQGLFDKDSVLTSKPVSPEPEEVKDRYVLIEVDGGDEYLIENIEPVRRLEPGEEILFTGPSVEYIKRRLAEMKRQDILDVVKLRIRPNIQESDKTYKAKASGKWLSGNKLVKDEKDADTFESKTEPTQRLNQMKKDGKLNKNAKITVIDEALKNLFDEMLNEAITDFDKSNRGMYRYAKRKHDETKAIRKVSKEPYWVHPEGVAKIIMEHGGSDIEIKAGMAHDLLEDTGCTYDDLVEKFGEKVASIVKEVTNDKAEIEKVGKEKYISEELVRLSPEALTVKLSDMLYNMKDSPTESNYKRMRNNVTFLMMNRELSGIHCRLVDEILEV